MVPWAQSVASIDRVDNSGEWVYFVRWYWSVKLLSWFTVGSRTYENIVWGYETKYRAMCIVCLPLKSKPNSAMKKCDKTVLGILSIFCHFLLISDDIPISLCHFYLWQEVSAIYVCEIQTVEFLMQSRWLIVDTYKCFFYINLMIRFGVLFSGVRKVRIQPTSLARMSDRHGPWAKWLVIAC